MKAAELRQMTDEELKAKLDELKEELFQLRFQKAAQAGAVDKPHRFRQIRRDIARILTVLRERELARSKSS